MPGLLELLGASTGDPNKDSAINQGILQAGLSLLNSKGNTANALGQAGMAGIQGFQQASQQNFLQQQQAQQIKQWDEQNRQTERKKQIEGLAPKFYKPASNGNSAVVQQTGGLAPTMANAQIQQANATPGGFDWNGYIQAVEAVDPVQALQLRQMTAKQEKDPIKLGQGETLIDPKTLKPVYQSAAKPEPTPSAVKEYEYAKGQGYGGTFEQFQLAQKKAGASNTSVKIDNKFGEGVAKEVGPMLKSSYDSAIGAQASIGTADSLIKAIDSGKVISGPGANLRLKGAQFAQSLGVGGKDNAEQILNTRAAIQGLAQTTLTARKQLSGQGQVSDNEGRLLERAASGDIEDMTASEIRQIAVVNKRLAQRQVKMHDEFVKKIRSNPSTSELSTMFELPTSGDVQGAPATSGGWSITPK